MNPSLLRRAGQSLVPAALGAAVAALLPVEWLGSVERRLIAAGLLCTVALKCALDHRRVPAVTDGDPPEAKPAVAAEQPDADAVQFDFVADVAHELRAPLSALRLQAQVEHKLGDQRKPNASTVSLSDSIDRLIQLFDQLTVVARIRVSGLHSAELAIVDLADLCADVARSMSASARRSNQTLEQDLQPATVMGHAFALQLAVRNLLENALRYTPAGGAIRIRCGLDGGHAFIAIDDSGAGVASADRERVFERFVRLEKGQPSGSGLGLSIVRLVAGAHHGEAFLTQGPQERGTTALLRFPSRASKPASIGPGTS